MRADIAFETDTSLKAPLVKEGVCPVCHKERDGCLTWWEIKIREKEGERYPEITVFLICAQMKTFDEAAAAGDRYRRPPEE